MSPFKLDAQAYTYTMLVVDLVMESVLAASGKTTPKPELVQMSDPEQSDSIGLDNSA